jgi:hypothetical protein
MSLQLLAKIGVVALAPADGAREARERGAE